MPPLVAEAVAGFETAPKLVSVVLAHHVHLLPKAAEVAGRTTQIVAARDGATTVRVE